MDILLTCHIHPTAVTIDAPTAHRSFDLAPIIIYHDDGRILAVGETAADLQRESPAHWQRYQHELRVMEPFQPAQFRPDYASAFLRYYAVKIHMLIRPRFYSLLRLLDRFIFNIGIHQWSTIPIQQRQEFTQLMRTCGPIHTLKIRDL
jgi:hypothetical protein